MAAKPKVDADAKTATAIATVLEELATLLKGSYGQGVLVHALNEIAARLRSGKL